MPLPMPRPLPEDNALDIEGDAPVGLVLAQGCVVAIGDADTTVPSPYPITVNLEFHVAALRPDRDDLSGIRAECLVAWIPPTTVLLRVPPGAIRGLHAIAVQRDPVDLDERGKDLTGPVRDRAGGRERSFLRDAARGRVCLVAAAIHRLRGVGRAKHVADRDEIRRTRDMRIPGRETRVAHTPRVGGWRE